MSFISLGNLNSPFGCNLNGNFLGNETFSYLKSEKYSSSSIHIQYSYNYRVSVEIFKVISNNRPGLNLAVRVDHILGVMRETIREMIYFLSSLLSLPLTMQRIIKKFLTKGKIILPIS